MWLYVCSYSYVCIPTAIAMCIPSDRFSFQFKDKINDYTREQSSKLRLVVVGPLDSDRKKNTGKIRTVEHRLSDPTAWSPWATCSLPTPFK